MKLKSIINKINKTVFNNGNKVTQLGTGNKINHKGNYISNTSIFIAGDNNEVLIEENGKSTLQNCNIYISGSCNKIIIGKHNNIVTTEFYIEDNNSTINFGDNNTLHGKTHLAAIEGTSIIIGNNCLFSSNITFRTGDSHSILDAETSERINPSESIEIGDRVWIGNDTKILKGTKILEDSIVATGSIVTKKFEENNVVIGGGPAKIIRTGVKWISERI